MSNQFTNVPAGGPGQQGHYPHGGQPPAPRRISTSGIFIIVGAIVVVALLAVGAYFLTRPATPPTSSTSPATSAGSSAPSPSTSQAAPPSPEPSVNKPEALAALPKEAAGFSFETATDDTGVYMTPGAKSIIMVSVVTGGMDFWSGGLGNPTQSEGGAVICGDVDGGPACVVSTAKYGVINLNATENTGTADEVAAVAKAIYDKLG